MNIANRARSPLLLREGSQRSSFLIQRLPLWLTLATMLALGAAQVASATDSVDSWVGRTSGLFNGANWMGTSNPAIFGDSLVFGSAGSASATLASNWARPAALRISGLTFHSGAAAVINPHTAGRNCLSLTGNVADITGNDLLTIGADDFTVDPGQSAETLSLHLALDFGQPWIEGSPGTMLANSAPLNGEVNLLLAGSGTVGLPSTVLPGADSHVGSNLNTGATNVNSGAPNATTGIPTSLNGTNSVAAGSGPQTAGTTAPPTVAGSPSQQPTALAIGPVTIANPSSAASVPRGLPAGGTPVSVTPASQPLVSVINLTNGATFDAGQGTGIYGFNSGGGTITVSGTATIGGVLQAGSSDTDPVLVIGLTPGATLDFTGVLRGSISTVGVNVNFANGGIDHEGFSPTFISNAGGTFNFSSSSTVAFDSANPYLPAAGSPNSPALVATAGAGGGYTQYLIAGTYNGTSTTPGVGHFTAGNQFAWDTATSTITASTLMTGAYASEAFYVVRTDGHMWPNNNVTGGPSALQGNYQYLDGTLTGFSNITISSFTGLPTLPSGYQWDVESTSEYIKLYVGVTMVGTNGVGEGSGFWKNGGATPNQNWTTNSGLNSNWGGGQPSSAGEIATFDSSVIHYAGGVVNVDAPETIGGISLSDSGQGGYTIGTNGGNALTLNNVTNDGMGDLTPIDPTIVVNSGTHTIAAPLVIESGSASGGVNGLAVTVDSGAMLTISGVISSGYNTENNLAKLGGGTLVLSGANTYTGSTTVSGGNLTLAFGAVSSNILPSTSALILDNGTLTLTGTNTLNVTQTVNGLTTTANSGNQIQLGTNETLTLGALTSAGSGSSLNFNTSAGGANANTSTVGTGVVVLTGQTPGAVINRGFTVTDSTGYGLATVNGSNDVVRIGNPTLLPAFGATSSTDYTVDNNPGTPMGNPLSAGSANLHVVSESADSITVDTTNAGGTLTLATGSTVLRTDVWNFGTSGLGSNSYTITGGTLQSVLSGDSITFSNDNNGPVTIFSPIADNTLGSNSTTVYLNGSGTTVLAGANTFTGGTTLNGTVGNLGTLQVGISSTTTGSGAGMTITSGATGTGVLNVRGGTLNLSTFNLAVGGLDGNTRAFIGSTSTTTAGSLTIVTNGTPQTYNGIIADTTAGGIATGGNPTVSVEVDGTGRQTLNGRNNYSGTTTVNSGTLELGNSGSIYSDTTATSQVVVNSGGTLLFSGNNNINNSSTNIVFDGRGSPQPSIAVGSSNDSQTVGTLTLSSTSTIDFSTFNNNELNFADSHGISWSGNTLNIYDWVASDALYFGSNSLGLTATQLSEIRFYSDMGTTFLGTGQISSTGLVTPIPEPSTVLVGLSLLSLAVYRERRRFRRGKPTGDTG